MLRSLLLVLLFVVASNPTFCQKGWSYEKEKVVFPYVDRGTFVTYFAPKQYEIDVLRIQGAKPKLPGMAFFNPGEELLANTSGDKEVIKERIRNFNSVQFYSNLEQLEEISSPSNITDPADYQALGILLELRTPSGDTKAYVFPESFVESYFTPFFFKKTEVTNNEYRQFVHYVRDSIAHQLLGHVDKTGKLDWSKDIDFSSPELKSMFTKPGAFAGNPELRSDKMIYAYENEEGQSINVPIYPDTLVWVNDFYYSYNEPMTRTYFKHPSFDDYPVVGIDWHAAKAFCNWIQPQIEARLRAQGIKGRIEVDLPKELEWEWMATYTCEGCQSTGSLVDDSYLCDLEFHRPKDAGEDRMDLMMQPNQADFGDFTLDGLLYTHTTKLNKRDILKNNKLENLDQKMQALFWEADRSELGVTGMSNNVSEWCLESYSDWAPSFNLYKKQLEQLPRPEHEILLKYLEYTDGRCAKDGRLVRGGSWYDEHFTVVAGRNKAGIQAKNFVHPDEAHSTIGFRYVVRIIPEE